MSEAQRVEAAKKSGSHVNGRQIDGREVIDGKVWSGDAWIDGIVFDKDNWTVKEESSDKEMARIALDGHKEIPENFRRAVLAALEAVSAGGYNVEVRYAATTDTVDFGIKVVRKDNLKPAIPQDTPLAQATLPREGTAKEQAEKLPKTAEERDEKAIREGTVPLPGRTATPPTAVYGSQTKTNPAGTPAYPK